MYMYIYVYIYYKIMQYLAIKCLIAFSLMIDGDSLTFLIKRVALLFTVSCKCSFITLV